MNRNAELHNWCVKGALPDRAEFYRAMTDEGGKFTELEGQYWDFKREWPFSYSDDYFGGICRLACAFVNSGGGLIIFGVSDEKRTGGHNRVRPNLDKFLQAFRQLTGSDIQCEFRSYTEEQCGDCDVLLVKPRRPGEPPFRFLRQLGPYQAGVLWVRNGHEVQPASPQSFAHLFCRADPLEIGNERGGSIPPSPATMRRFVGRVQVLDRLFEWLESSDEPRTYLHGKGGSGKTTIAYEFARLVKDFGENLRIERNDKVEVVIFLSAKERALIPVTGMVESLGEPDFSDEKTLLSQILYFGDWTSDRVYLDGLNVQQLRGELQQYLDMTSVLLILDDVDTLTTKGVDPGADNLYRALCRSKRRSRVLYTLRNAPSQSLHSSIEVPGLHGDDYEIFVSECAKQFNVKEPSKDFRTGRLPQISERRPLVIESIVALVRTAGSYERAADLFSQHAGDNVRDYVFIREWDALTGDPASRLLLSALADLGRPASFSDLRTVLHVDDSGVQDAIGKVREMFLHIDQTGKETLYSLAPLTKHFVNSRKNNLHGYRHIAERVKTFKKNIRITSPEVASLVTKVQRLLPLREHAHEEDRAFEAWRLVSDSALPPKVTEDPVFRSVYGYVCVNLPAPRLTEAREAFLYVTSMRHEPSFPELRQWFNAEKNSGVLDGWCERIADLVIDGRTYSETEKIAMISRKAISVFTRARERIYTEPTDAEGLFFTALTLHLKTFRLNGLRGDWRIDQSEEYARNTAYQCFKLSVQSNQPWGFFECVLRLLNEKEIFLDPIERPFLDTITFLERLKLTAGEVGRLRNSMSGLSDRFASREIWLDGGVGDRLKNAVKKFNKSVFGGA